MNISSEIERFSPFLELIAPNGGELFQEKLVEILEETGGLDELIMLQQLGIIFLQEEDQFYELIQSIRKLAAEWDANVFTAADDFEEESVLFDYELSDLLKLAATELSGYELNLWQIDNEKFIAGFISRESDCDLIEKLAPNLRLKLEPVQTF